MRYLITVSSLTPGSGLSRYVFSLCSMLSVNNDVFVATTHNSNDITYEQEELQKISSSIKLISLGCSPTPQKYIKAIHLVWSIKPNVIVNNYNGVFQFILPFISARIKVIHILHNDTDDFYRIGSINGGRVCGWIAPTQAIADHFNAYSKERYADKVSTIPHGVEEATYQPRDNSRLEIVYAGVLYEHKGVKILPTIIKRLLLHGINLHFTIIGKGALSEWLKDQFSEEIKAGIINMTGVVGHNEVYRHMSKADIFLYPTHLDAFGLVIAEAMMNGAAPVVTCLQGITDNLITNGHDGFLMPQDDINQFVNTITKLYEDRALIERVGRAAHQRAMDCFSHKSMKESYISYFHQLLN